MFKDPHNFITCDHLTANSPVPGFSYCLWSSSYLQKLFYCMNWALCFHITQFKVCAPFCAVICIWIEGIQNWDKAYSDSLLSVIVLKFPDRVNLRNKGFITDCSSSQDCRKLRLMVKKQRAMTECLLEPMPIFSALHNSRSLVRGILPPTVKMCSVIAVNIIKIDT